MPQEAFPRLLRSQIGRQLISTHYFNESVLVRRDWFCRLRKPQAFLVMISVLICTRMNSEEPKVYFITAGDVVKIGVSRQPNKRLRQLQSSSSKKLTLAACCFGGFAMEKSLHKRFASHRLQGEWFMLTDEIKRLIDATGIEIRENPPRSCCNEALFKQTFAERAHKARVTIPMVCKRAGIHRQSWSRAMKRGNANYTLIDPLEKAMAAIEQERANA